MVTCLVSYCDMYDLCIKMLVGWSLQLFVVSTLFVFVCIKVVSNTYCVVPYILFCLRLVSCVLNVACFSGLSSSCVLSAQCCQCLRIVFVLCLVCPMLSVSQDCLRPVSCVSNVVSVSGLSILDCPFCFP